MPLAMHLRCHAAPFPSGVPASPHHPPVPSPVQGVEREGEAEEARRQVEQPLHHWGSPSPKMWGWPLRIKKGFDESLEEERFAS